MADTDTTRRVLDDTSVEQFENILSGTASLGTEHASAIVDYMCNRNEAQQVDLMQILIERFGLIKPTGYQIVGRRMSEEKFNQLQQSLENVIVGTLKLIIHTRKSAPQAARQLRDLVFSFDDDDYKDYCVASIMADPAIPYRQVPFSTVIDFTTPRLQVILEKNEEAVLQLSCIRRAEFSPTVEAELILSVLEALDTNEERIGIMQVFLGSERAQNAPR